MTLADIQNRFHHQPTEGQVERYTKIRSEALSLALLLEEACPDSGEKSLAVTKLEEAVMWANAAIARNTGSRTTSTAASCAAAQSTTPT